MTRLRLHLSDRQRSAVQTAVRGTIVVPSVFAIGLVLGNDAMALFAGFGAVALLGLVDFGGPVRARFAAYVGLVLAGAVLVTIGTLVLTNLWLAAATTVLVVFVLLFSGIVNPYAAAGGFAALLTYFVAVLVPAPVSELGSRLEGWALASAAALPAALLLWPPRTRDRLQTRAADACKALSECVAAASWAGAGTGRESGAGAGSGGDTRGAETQARAVDAVEELRHELATTPYRPTGTTGRTAALGRLVTDMVWVRPFLRPLGRRAAGPALPAESADIVAVVADVLAASANTLDGRPERPDIHRLTTSRAALWQALDDRLDGPGVEWHREGEQSVTSDESVLAATVDEVFRLRLLSYGARHIAVHSLVAVGEEAPDPDDMAIPGTGRPSEDGTGVHGTYGRFRAALSAARKEAAAHLTTRSVWFRNSLRGAVALSIAVLVAQLADLQHGFWVTLGTLSVLRSSAVGTGSTVLRALAGTVAGIIAGGVLIVLVGDNDALMWALFPVSVFMAFYGSHALSYVAFQAAFTVLVFLLFGLIEPIGLDITVVRVEDVAIGCAIALGVGLLLWPRGAAAAVRQAVASAYASSVDYMATAIDALVADGEFVGSDSGADEARRVSRRLDDAFRQFVDERSPERIELGSLTVLIAGANRLRFVGHAIELSHDLWQLQPAQSASPSLDHARQVLAADLQEMRTWYHRLGQVVLSGAAPPTPMPHDPPGSDHAARWLEGATAPGSRTEVRLRVAVAWAGEHLEVLRSLQPRLIEAATEVAPGRQAPSEGAQPAHRADRVELPRRR